MMIKNYSIVDESVNSRLDRWFRRNVSDVPQSLIEKNLRKGNIKVKNKKFKSQYKLCLKDQVTVRNLSIIPNKNKINKEKYNPTRKEV